MSDFTENIELANNWVLCTFSDVSEGDNAIVDGPFGSNLKTSDYIDEPLNGVPVLTTKNLEGDYSDKTVRFISKAKFEELKRSQVKPGDILVAKIGSIGKTGIYPKNARTAIIPANLLKFTVSKEVEFNYVYFYLNFFGLQNKIKAIATATAQPAFNITKFRLLEVPLPPRNEQHRIVAKIEELFSSLDKGIESLKTAQQQLKVYRQAVLKWAFKGKLTNKNVVEGELPEGWQYKKINELGRVETGTTPSKKNPSFYSDEYPFYKPTDLNAGNSVVSSTDGLSELGIKEARFVPASSTLVTCIGATIGKTGFIKKGGGFNQQINAIIPSTEHNPKFIFYQAVSPKFQEQIKNNASATTLPILNKGKFENLMMVCCLPEEQHAIVAEIESRLSVCDKIEESIEQSLKQSKALRQSILKKAFEGKLVSQDPNDEPASVLLERIRGDREKQAAEQRNVNSKRKTKNKPSSVGARC